LSNKRGDIKEFYNFALDLVDEAAERSMDYYGQGHHNIRFDEALITRAEIEIVNLFNQRIKQRFPDHKVFDGRTIPEAYSHGSDRYLWIFDPCDGVANYQAGIPIWGISLALIENFWPVFGIITLPATKDTFQATGDNAALWGHRQIKISPQESIDDESVLLTYSRFHQQYRTTFPGKIRNMGSTAAHICHVAMGRADAAIIANESFQGLAAARVIIEAAGGKIYKIDGSEFFLNEYLDGGRIRDHLLVTTPNLVNQVAKTLERVI
jgi:myo-inositol-1(or 4)-monophosphatase